MTFLLLNHDCKQRRIISKPPKCQMKSYPQLKEMKRGIVIERALIPATFQKTQGIIALYTRHILLMYIHILPRFNSNLYNGNQQNGQKNKLHNTEKQEY